MRIALIGLGDIAQKAYLPLLASDERVTPLLCTRSPSVLDKLARQYRIAECFTEVDALLGVARRRDDPRCHRRAWQVGGAVPACWHPHLCRQAAL